MNQLHTLGRIARLGCAAFALGLSLAGPQGLGVASADTGADNARTASADTPSGGAATATRPSRGTRSGSVTETTASLPSGAARSRHAAAAQKEPTTAEVPWPNTAPEPVGAALPSAPAAVATLPTASADVVKPIAEPSVPPGVTSPSAEVSREPAPAIAATLAVTIPNPTAPPIAAAEPDTVTVVKNAVSTLGDLLTGALAGHGPTAPADVTGWTVLAGASRETFAAAAAVAATGSPSTTSALAIPETPLLTALQLQNVPIIGPLLVTPIVSAVNQIPIIGDLLHPIFGYPVLPQGFSAPRDARVISFDGTQTDAHFMPASGLRTGQTAPTVMLGSGLGLPGATNLNGTPLDAVLTDFLGAVSIATLRNAGYNVVTWDPRGEYFSGGVLQIDAPDYEARDSSAIINWIAAQPEAKLDGPRDPRMGMAGPSYGGGIQLVTAATDHRVDAIVPTIAWNKLTSALDTNGAFKSGWGTLLGVALALTLARVNPEIFPALAYGDLTGRLTPAETVLLAQRGPGPVDGFPDLVSQISAPTLLIQGTVDTLFSLKQADVTAKDLISHGVPTKVLWFCGGHGLCLNNLSDPSDGVLVDQRTIEWLDRYVKSETNVSTGPGFEWIDQRGQHLSNPTYGLASGAPAVASKTGHATLPLIPFVGGTGPQFGVVPTGGTKAVNAIDVTTQAASTTTYIVGEPELSLTYSGRGVGDYVFAQLVDDTTGLVLGSQVTPIPVTLDRRTHTIDIALQPVAHTLRPGETVTLQLAAWSADYAAERSLGALTVEDLRIALPTNGSATMNA